MVPTKKYLAHGTIVVQINTDDEKDGFELFTGTMMYFSVFTVRGSSGYRPGTVAE